MVVICYPMHNSFSGILDCFYLKYPTGYPERYELYDDKWAGGEVPFIGY